jgi:hypothetical protein
MALRSVPAGDLFRDVFCVAAAAEEARPLVLDVRPRSAWGRGHVANAFCVRVSSNGAVLADYSGGGQERPWSDGCWWGRKLLLYGHADDAANDADGGGGSGAATQPPLDARHPVAAFLLAEGRALSLTAVKGGCVPSRVLRVRASCRV